MNNLQTTLGYKSVSFFCKLGSTCTCTYLHRVRSTYIPIVLVIVFSRVSSISRKIFPKVCCHLEIILKYFLNRVIYFMQIRCNKALYTFLHIIQKLIPISLVPTPHLHFNRCVVCSNLIWANQYHIIYSFS